MATCRLIPTGFLLAAVLLAGCGTRSPQRLADRAASDKSGRVRMATEDDSRLASQSYRHGNGAPDRTRAPVDPGPIAMASHTPRNVNPISVRHSEPTTLTSANFDETVLNSPVPVLVDCWAPWCGPCKRMLPVVHELAEDFEGRAVVAKLDIEAHPEIASRYGVTSIPAFLIFQDGELVESVVGAVPKKHLAGKLAARAPAVRPASRDEAPLE